MHFRLLASLAAILITTSLHAQSLDDVLRQANFSKELGLLVDTENKYLPAFGREYTSVITFSYAESSVYYFVFDYSSVDSAAFWQGITKYQAVSSCSSESHEIFDKNFYTFNKNGFFFLLQHCPCRTTEGEECATLAALINRWAMKEE